MAQNAEMTRDHVMLILLTTTISDLLNSKGRLDDTLILIIKMLRIAKRCSCDRCLSLPNMISPVHVNLAVLFEFMQREHPSFVFDLSLANCTSHQMITELVKCDITGTLDARSLKPGRDFRDIVYEVVRSYVDIVMKSVHG
jgi:hypothetical protein